MSFVLDERPISLDIIFCYACDEYFVSQMQGMLIPLHILVYSLCSNNATSYWKIKNLFELDQEKKKKNFTTALTLKLLSVYYIIHH